MMRVVVALLVLARGPRGRLHGVARADLRRRGNDLVPRGAGPRRRARGRPRPRRRTSSRPVCSVWTFVGLALGRSAGRGRRAGEGSEELREPPPRGGLDRRPGGHRRPSDPGADRSARGDRRGRPGWRARACSDRGRGRPVRTGASPRGRRWGLRDVLDDVTSVVDMLALKGRLVEPRMESVDVIHSRPGTGSSARRRAGRSRCCPSPSTRRITRRPGASALIGAARELCMALRHGVWPLPMEQRSRTWRACRRCWLRGRRVGSMVGGRG